MGRTKSVTVDVKAISGVKHSCEGCTAARRCCCASFDVCATKREMDIILGIMPAVAEFCPALKTVGGFSNVFDETDDGLYSIDTDENGLCVFAYRSGKKIRCSIHSAALRMGVLPSSLKPTACTLWPLMLSDGPDALLWFSDGALQFDCCSKASGGRKRRISKAFADTIGDLWGAAARSKLVRAVERGARRTRIEIGSRKSEVGSRGTRDATAVVESGVSPEEARQGVKRKSGRGRGR